MHVTLLSQNPDGSDTLEECLRALADDEELAAVSLRAASAYTSSQGIRTLADLSDRIHQRRGKVEVILGYDAGQTKSKCLREALYLLPPGSVLIVGGKHVRFHPKVYVFRGRGGTVAIIGSANATQGGLQRNWECSCVVRCSRGDDPEFLRQLARAWDGYKAGMSQVAVLDGKWLEEHAEDLEANDAYQEQRREGASSLRQIFPAVPSGPRRTHIASTSREPERQARAELRLAHIPPAPTPPATASTKPQVRNSDAQKIADWKDLYNRITARERDKSAKLGGILKGQDDRMPWVLSKLSRDKGGMTLSEAARHLGGYRSGEALADDIVAKYRAMKAAKGDTTMKVVGGRYVDLYT
jgi:HKD family nuclease